MRNKQRRNYKAFCNIFCFEPNTFCSFATVFLDNWTNMAAISQSDFSCHIHLPPVLPLQNLISRFICGPFIVLLYLFMNCILEAIFAKRAWTPDITACSFIDTRHPAEKSSLICQNTGQAGQTGRPSLSAAKYFNKLSNVCFVIIYSLSASALSWSGLRWIRTLSRETPCTPTVLRRSLKHMQRCFQK